MTRDYGRLFALLVSLLLVASVTLPGAVAGTVAEDPDDDLTLEVTQDHETGEVLVTLEDNATDDLNATLDVSGDFYVGNGSYDFPANGSLTLDAPTESGNVTFYAETNDSRNVSVGEFQLVPLEESLSVSVNQSDAGVEIFVEQYGEAVEDADVNVTVPDENESYVDTGTYTTDENGTVGLSNPDKPVTIAVEAAENGVEANTTAELSGAGLSVSAYQDVNNSVIIDVTYDGEAVEGANVTVTGDYTYADEYDTDENGSVELNPPANDTSIDITVDYQGLTAEITNWAIEASDSEGESGFAKALVKYIEFVKMEGLEVPGQYISAFVHENNPSSADDDAGPPEHAGPKNSVTASSNTSTHGPPAWAGPSNNSTATTQDDHGPPEVPPGQAKKDKDKGNNGNGHGGNPHVDTDEETDEDNSTET